MARMDKLSTYKTTVEVEGDKGSVIYVNTKIVAWDGDNITLNSGGWQTVTTKRKMCQASNQFGLRFTVYQRKGIWYVDVKYHGGLPHGYWSELNIPFFDGMTFNKYTGQVVNPKG